MFENAAVKEDAKKQIVVIKLGWVLFGTVSEYLDTLDITNAQVIRRWGTTKGLGELASRGPAAETKLDPCGSVVVERAAVLFRIDCEAKPWAKY